MGRLSWPPSPLPDGSGEVWRWQLGAIGDLPVARERLRDRLGHRAEPSRTDGEAAEGLVLAFDELASNALRHGDVPVVASVMAGSGGWILDVSDRAPDTLPAPAVDRDPARGGLGLQLVARLSVAHGWYVEDGRKHVWACLPAASSAPAFA